MATTAKTHKRTPPPDTPFEPIKDSGAKLLTYARKAGNASLDGYEKTVDRAIELELKVAGMTQQEWLKHMIETQTEFARELTDSYTTYARRLLK